MKSFIDHVAQNLMENYAGNLENVCVVFPNRRAGLYLRKSLSALINQPIFMPSVMAIEDFVYKLMGYQKIEPVYLQFELYEIYRKLNEKQPQSFIEFLNWGEIVLRDFNEIDLAMVDPEALFSYLNETKALTLWNLDKVPLTEFQQNYLQFYNSLGQLYSLLRENLTRKGQLYQGLAYRLFAERLQKEDVEFQWKHIIFAGFNALTKAEEVIFKKLKASGQATLLWDGDIYYADDPVQEAGRFIRKNRKFFSPFKFLGSADNFSETPKNIEVIGVPQRVGQARLAGDILQKLHARGEVSTNTAIILNDEDLVIPLLNSLPGDLADFNVTMGLPLNQIPILRLVNKILDLHENALKLKRYPDDPLRFYYKDLFDVIESPYFDLLNSDIEFISQLTEKIKSKNQIFIAGRELLSLWGENSATEKRSQLYDIINDWNNEASRAIDGLKTLLNLIKDKLTENQNAGITGKLDMEYLFYLSKVLNNLQTIVDSHSFINDLKTFRMIFNQVIQSIKIPFYGEPLQGVQIMGMLESRVLDFENLIILSVNEDFLPAGKSTNSFIPFEVKRQFEIPAFREHNAVVAYHFYRLLQRASHVFLLYNTEPGDLGGGDKSRFIMQLMHELQQKSPKSQIREQVVNLSESAGIKDEPIVVEKDEVVMGRLNELAAKGFSASGLNTYRKCSFQFYLKYIAGIKELEEPEETIEASTLGTVIHEVLQKMYAPFKDQFLQKENLTKLKAEAGTYIRESFNKNYPGGDLDHGKNLLIVKVAETYADKFIDQEIEWLNSVKSNGQSVRIEELEKQFDHELTLTLNNRSTLVKLKGVFDRVDRVGAVTRIIDYKTGRVDPSDLKFKEWESLLDDPTLEKCFQVMFYQYIYQHQKAKDSTNIESGIISLRKLSNGFMTVIEPGQNEENSESFEKMLISLVESIFDPRIPFSQTSDITICRYCAFSSLCNR